MKEKKHPKTTVTTGQYKGHTYTKSKPGGVKRRVDRKFLKANWWAGQDAKKGFK